VIITGGGDLAGRIMQITRGKGVDVAFDSVGAGLIAEYSRALARNARIYFYGELDTKRPELPFVDTFQKNVVFHPYSVFNYVDDPETCGRGVAFVHEMLRLGRIRPQIDRIYPMEQYIEAFDYLSRRRKTHGKVVIETGL
jgi:NADPH2:quinone reductase